jgi:hypothetical protein
MLNRQSGANRISVANDVPAINPGMTGDKVLGYQYDIALQPLISTGMNETDTIESCVLSLGGGHFIEKVYPESKTCRDYLVTLHNLSFG